MQWFPVPFYVGVDLGQAHDYSALAVLEEQYFVDRYWAVRLRHPANSWTSPLAVPQRYRHDFLRALIAKPTKPYLHVRHLERFPLGTPYPDIVRRTIELITGDPISAFAYAFPVDATGVGRAVVEMFSEAGLRPLPILITGGNDVSLERGRYSVPKRELVASAQVTLQERRLKVAPALQFASILVEELRNFRLKMSPAGHDQYEAWRERDHDDLVLAVSLALWYRDWWNRAADRRTVRRRASV